MGDPLKILLTVTVYKTQEQCFSYDGWAHNVKEEAWSLKACPSFPDALSDLTEDTTFLYELCLTYLCNV